MDVLTVDTELRKFAAKIEAIERNDDLSPTGKEKQKAVVAGEIQAYRREVFAEQSAFWKTVQRDYAAYREKLAAAEANAGGKWDYSRLAYETQTARNELEKADSFSSVREVYTRWVGTADNHRARAMCDVVESSLSGRFKMADGLAALIGDANERLKKLLDTEELAEARREGEEISAQAYEGYTATRNIAATFDGGHPSPGNEFMQLLSGVNLTPVFNRVGPSTQMALTMD